MMVCICIKTKDVMRKQENQNKKWNWFSVGFQAYLILQIGHISKCHTFHKKTKQKQNTNRHFFILQTYGPQTLVTYIK